MKRTAAVLLLVILLTSCEKTTKKDDEIIDCFPEPSSLTLPLNNCADKGPETAMPPLCFLQLVQDSRCPLNAVCVWEGVAVARLSFRVAGTEHQLTLATKKFGNGPSTDTSVSGYKIQLLGISPYPGAPPQPATATVKVTRQ